MVHANTVSLDEMRGDLLTLDQVRERLSATEPLSEVTFEVGSGTTTRIEESWAQNKEKGLTDYVDAFVRLPAKEDGTGPKEYQLTKQAVLQLGAAFGYPRGLQARMPHDLLQRNINTWLASDTDRDLKLLAKDDHGVALTRATVSPFSNLKLLDIVIAGLNKKYGEGEILADYKFSHDLEATSVRLIVPGERRIITGTPVADDTWSAGIQFKNSLVGLRQTELAGYLFRFWCTNGSIDTMHDTGGYSRRGNTEEDMLAWASSQIDEVLGGLEPMLDHVQELTAQQVTGNVRQVLGDLFDNYGLPVRDRARVVGEMADTDDMTMYSLMQAITQAANLDGLAPRTVERLMRMGGHVAATHSERCNLGKVHLN